MRRIAGSFVILATLGGCTPQQRLAQGDWAPTTHSSGHTTVAGSSWPRDDANQLPTGPTADAPGWRRDSAGFQQPHLSTSVAPAPMQTAAKLPFATGSPASCAPVPLA